MRLLFRAVYTGTRPGLTPAIRAGKGWRGRRELAPRCSATHLGACFVGAYGETHVVHSGPHHHHHEGLVQTPFSRCEVVSCLGVRRPVSQVTLLFDPQHVVSGVGAHAQWRRHESGKGFIVLSAVFVCAWFVMQLALRLTVAGLVSPMWSSACLCLRCPCKSWPRPCLCWKLLWWRRPLVGVG